MMSYYCPVCRKKINVDSSNLVRRGNKIECAECRNLIALDEADYTFG
jgi:DNA-directed RNA polymerase subunit RPC12/RpoP